MNKYDAFISLANLFIENGFKLFLVGGSVRDYLLFHQLNDLDVVTDAKVEEVESFYQEKATYTFKKYGAMSLYHEGFKFDVTTLRKEEGYLDSRHPSKIIFVKDLKDDVIRRDFTINALYMDKNNKIYDYVDGLNDLNNKIIKMIGNPKKRIEEDPLRILRAIRFKITFNFSFDEELEKVIRENISLLENLNPEKIKEEIRKMKKSKEELSTVFKDFNILHLLTMIK